MQPIVFSTCSFNILFTKKNWNINAKEKNQFVEDEIHFSPISAIVAGGHCGIRWVHGKWAHFRASCRRGHFCETTSAALAFLSIFSVAIFASDFDVNSIASARRRLVSIQLPMLVRILVWSILKNWNSVKVQTKQNDRKFCVFFTLQYNS